MHANSFIHLLTDSLYSAPTLPWFFFVIFFSHFDQDMHVVTVAQAEAEVMADGSEVNVVDDETIARPVVELAGKASLLFPCSSILGHVMLHIKNQERFMRVEVEIVDDKAGESGYRTLRFDNRRSIATVTPEASQSINQASQNQSRIDGRICPSDANFFRHSNSYSSSDL